jgi:hypothetical protein
MSSLISFFRSRGTLEPKSAREIPVGQGLGGGSARGKLQAATGLNDDVKLMAGNVSRDKGIPSWMGNVDVTQSMYH